MSKKQETFEASLKKLESIVESLEGGELSLEDSLARFEEGVRCAGRCQETLKGAELKVERLLKAKDGGYSTEPFDQE